MVKDLITCEVCGSPLRGPPNSVEIDGAVLRVCQGCAKRGRPVGVSPTVRRPGPLQFGAPRQGAGRSFEPELEVDPDYAVMVRRARESLGLTQEALGKMINVKPSVISHIETGKMKPDMILARTLMHSLKVNLLVPGSDLESRTR